jgi:ABC-2 type transport system permease protein
MGKYLSVFCTSFKQEKDTILDKMTRCIGYFVIIFIFVQLWGYIYGESGPNQVINGYTLPQMLWYLLITEFIYYIARSKQITVVISNEIKSGSIAYKLNKPYNYYLYCLSQFFAKSIFGILFMLPVTLIIGVLLVGTPSTFCMEQILPCLLVSLLVGFLTWAIYGVVGLIAFWTQDSTPYYWVVSKFFMIFGLFFPISFFPIWLQPIITYSPIFALMSGPASLVANFSWELFGQVLLSQVVWISISLVLGLWMFNKGKKKVTSNGG